ncbi:hypothetical protein [Actinomadura miaoliensis]|uniref:Uncharacterized protein n=1 Tax=Actinomadura miaoliensis TaxID=430685 RepID=A0ABP7WZY8_9ACTN
MSVSQALANMVKDGLVAKTFSSGSKGFHTTGKITVDGVRYQAQAQAVLIGSKADPKVKVQAKRDEAVSALATFTDGLTPKMFSTGRTGFYATGKVEIGGQRYQAQAQAVRLD